MKKTIYCLILLALFIFSGCFSEKGAPRERRPHVDTSRSSSWSKINKIVVVVLENTEYEDAVNQPFIKRLSKEGALLTNYYGITHPSQPNYLAMISGHTHGVEHNDDVTLTASHLGELLDAAGKTWKSYAEGYPGNCFLGSVSGAYTRKHVPFLSFSSVQSNPTQCNRVVNADQFRSDLQSQSLPHFSLYIPDANNDGHDTGVQFADRWLAQFFEPVFADKKGLQDTLYIVTFDEGSRDRKNRIVTIFYGSGVKPGSESHQDYDHYCLLRTIEEIYQLPTLKRFDQSAPAIDDIWTD